MRYSNTTSPWQLLDEMARELRATPARGLTNGADGNVGSAAFPIDVLEQDDHLLVQVNLPGVQPDSVNLSLEGNTLTLTARLADENPEGKRYLWRERPAGEVRRAITLPVRLNPERTEASLEHGVLTVRVDKAPEVTARKIPVSATSGRQAIPQG